MKGFLIFFTIVLFSQITRGDEGKKYEYMLKDKEECNKELKHDKDRDPLICIQSMTKDPDSNKDMSAKMLDDMSYYYFEPSVILRLKAWSLLSDWNEERILSLKSTGYNANPAETDNCITFGMPILSGINERICIRAASPGDDESTTAKIEEKNNAITRQIEVLVNSKREDESVVDRRIRENAIKANEMLYLNPINADPGYTKNRHINDKGREVTDESFRDDNNKKLAVDLIKLCVYNDPSVWQSPGGLAIMSGVTYALAFSLVGMTMIPIIVPYLSHLIDVDIVDIFPNYQPYHQGAQPPKVLSLLFPLSEKITGNLFSANSIVKGSYGCINYPMGPFPPRYCSLLEIPTTKPKTMKVCSSVNEKRNNITDNECMIAHKNNRKIDNNFIHNTIRVLHSVPIKLCDKPNEINCVEVKNMNFAEISDTDSVLKSNVTLRVKDKNRNKTEDENKIVSLSIESICKNSAEHIPNLNCRDGKQLLPIYLISNQSLGKITSHYYNSSTMKSSSTTLSEAAKSNLRLEKKISLQNEDIRTLWGVDIGDYDDITVSFQNTSNQKYQESENKAIGINEQGKVTDTTQKNKDFNATDNVYYAQIGSKENKIQNYNEICVYRRDTKQGDTKIGCQKREMAGKIVLSEEGQNENEDILKSYLSPKVKAQMEIKNKDGSLYSTPNSSVNIPNIKDTYKIDGTFIAAQKIDFFIADSSGSDIQQTGNNELNECKNCTNTNKMESRICKMTSCGSYLDNAQPNFNISMLDKNKNQGIFFKKGIEFAAIDTSSTQTYYRRGGEKICVRSNMEAMSIETNFPVLARCVEKNSLNDSIVDARGECFKKNGGELDYNSKKDYVSKDMKHRIIPDSKNTSYNEFKELLKKECQNKEPSIQNVKTECEVNAHYDNRVKTVDSSYKVDNLDIEYQCIVYKTKDNSSCYRIDFYNKYDIRMSLPQDKVVCTPMKTPKCNHSTLVQSQEYHNIETSSPEDAIKNREFALGEAFDLSDFDIKCKKDHNFSGTKEDILDILKSDFMNTEIPFGEDMFFYKLMKDLEIKIYDISSTNAIRAKYEYELKVYCGFGHHHSTRWIDLKDCLKSTDEIKLKWIDVLNELNHPKKKTLLAKFIKENYKDELKQSNPQKSSAKVYCVLDNDDKIAIRGEKNETICKKIEDKPKSK